MRIGSPPLISQHIQSLQRFETDSTECLLARTDFVSALIKHGISETEASEIGYFFDKGKGRDSDLIEWSFLGSSNYRG
jgi:hypothetical protein